MSKILKKDLLLILSFVLLLIISCSKNDNPVTSQEGYSPDIPVDPSAPQIPLEWENWIKSNSKKIKSLDSFTNTDIQFLKSLLVNKKIVQLGESSHGTQEFSKAKVHLIKYLHEEMGFNIIAFESSVFDCFYAYNNISNAGSEKLMSNSIFGVWYTEEVKELFTYIIQIQNSSNPLILVGFDIQPSSLGSQYRPGFLKSVFNIIDPQKADSLFQLDTFFLSLKSGGINADKNHLIQEYESYLNLLDNNWEKVVKAYPPNSPIPHIAKLSIRSNIHYINQNVYAVMLMPAQMSQERDLNMAFNLEYLFKNVYPNNKFIVWAHNVHICYNYARIKTALLSGANSMGYYLRQNLSNELYAVGLYMYKGKTAYNDRSVVTVQTMTSENIETVLYHSRYNYSFVDMLNQTNMPDNSWMFKEMNAKYWGNLDQLLIPREQYDAILYVYETHLPNYLNYQLMKMKSDGLLNLNYFR